MSKKGRVGWEKKGRERDGGWGEGGRQGGREVGIDGEMGRKRTTAALYDSVCNSPANENTHIIN